MEANLDRYEVMLQKSEGTLPISSYCYGYVTDLNRNMGIGNPHRLIFNVVLTESGELVELQGASEAAPFPRQRVAEILSLASRGAEPLFQAQRQTVR